ncbi:site-2 protease family protein [Tuwongella immobilis]|uniref:site-2 protease family protein n=1 Tax=Tuwongella immobilis TaxID=692036 RepID=UPI0013A70CEC|nr:site-2 protease family protein [Tuwongella immobilis]
MISLEPSRTPYDLEWRMFGFPIRVNPWFWLIMAMLGGRSLQFGFEVLLLFVLVAFVSVLVHELGHAFMMRRFGGIPRIVLTGFGGVAISGTGGRTRMERILISLAGPFAGLSLFGIVVGSDALFHWAETSRMTVFAYVFLYQVNLYWNILNLLPVFPLDGGQVVRNAVSRSEYTGLRLATQVSMVTCGIVVMYCFFANQLNWIPVDPLFTGVMFGLLGYQNYMIYQQLNGPRSFSDDPFRR